MKLLLTSGGLENEELQNVFCELLPRPAAEIKVSYIPTAAKNEKHRQQHIDAHIASLKEVGVVNIQMVELSELDSSEWLPIIEESDVIFVIGGDVYYLRDWFDQSGLSDELPRLLQSKVYVGISAGSKIMGPDCGVASLYYSPDKNNHGLGIVDFCIVPHMISKRFTDRTPEIIKPKLENIPYTTYLIDDNTAILVQGSMMQFVGGGEYVEFRK